MKNHFVDSIVRAAHLDTSHGSSTLVQGHLCQRFWIIRGRNYIRKIICQCVTCARSNGISLQQQIAPLPAIRLRPSRPFTSTEMDYTGPFWIKFSPVRGAKSFKSYVIIFLRAVHIEVVSDLTSKAFLAAFRRFAAQRGFPSVMTSDNGSNFREAGE